MTRERKYTVSPPWWKYARLYYMYMQRACLSSLPLFCSSTVVFLHVFILALFPYIFQVHPYLKIVYQKLSLVFGIVHAQKYWCISINARDITTIVQGHGVDGVWISIALVKPQKEPAIHVVLVMYKEVHKALHMEHGLFQFLPLTIFFFRQHCPSHPHSNPK